MSDTARDYQTVEPPTTEGLEDLFTQGVPEGLPLGVPQGLPEGLPVDEAALRLGLSERAVLKRLRRGTLKGFKVPAKRGEKWLVSLEGLPAGPTEGVPVEVEGLPDLEEEILFAPQGLPEGVPSGVEQLVSLVQDLQAKLDKANDQLQSASFRNGYLESKLEERDKEIKLLTDSQHKGSWWADFKKWFFGR
jgi:hypothetical protein